jgi:hypothetical protein
MRANSLALALFVITFSVSAVSQESGVDQALEKQLTATERQEYRHRLEQAENDAQRNQITQQYRKTVEQRGSSEAPSSAAGQKNQYKAGGQGQGNADVTRPGPAGSKNKPQKSGH